MGGDRGTVGSLSTRDVPECVDCGACCFSTLPEYVRVFGVDLDRMDERARSFADFVGQACFMRLDDGHCAALTIDPVQKRFVCAIYPMRPDVCRSLERGSGQCRADRHEKTERTLVAVERLLRR